MDLHAQTLLEKLIAKNSFYHASEVKFKSHAKVPAKTYLLNNALVETLMNSLRYIAQL